MRWLGESEEKVKVTRRYSWSMDRYLFKVVGFDDLTCNTPTLNADAHDAMLSFSLLFFSISPSPRQSIPPPLRTPSSPRLSTFRYLASVDSRHLKVILANYAGNLNSTVEMSFEFHFGVECQYEQILNCSRNSCLLLCQCRIITTLRH